MLLRCFQVVVICSSVACGTASRGGAASSAARAAARAEAPAPPKAVPPAAVSAPIVFRGTCDASGAVVLGGSRFAMADDENNVLRVYDSERGGDPIHELDVSPVLDLPPKKKKPPEADIEAATRLGDVAFWLTSHGRSSKGKLQPGRFRFFATSAPADGAGIVPVGTPYERLLEDMLADPRLAPFGLDRAAQLAPKDPGGLNIEGMTRRPDGRSVVIGFRNPRPEGKALLVVLENPMQVIHGERARLGEPQLLDLGGLGVRSLSFWHGRYLIGAGAAANEAPPRLFSWRGAGAAEPLESAALADLNPEAFVSFEHRDQVLVLSDDGTRLVDGVECKKLKDPAAKSFRGVWITP